MATLEEFIKPLENHIEQDFSELKFLRKKLEKAADEHEKAVDRYMAKKAKDPSIPEVPDLSSDMSLFILSTLSCRVL